MITLREFFRLKESTAVIHCDTLQKAQYLMTVFDKLGKTWWTKAKYNPLNSRWQFHKENTVYYNGGSYGSMEYITNEKVFEFDDIVELRGYDKNYLKDNNLEWCLDLVGGAL